MHFKRYLLQLSGSSSELGQSIIPSHTLLLSIHLDVTPHLNISGLQDAKEDITKSFSICGYFSCNMMCRDLLTL